MGITRRDLLVATVSVGAAGAVYGHYAGGLSVPSVESPVGGLASAAENASDDVFETPDPNRMKQELSNGFELLEWHQDGTATIHFDMDYYVDPMNGFAIYYEHKDDLFDSIQQCSVPESTTKLTVPLVEIIRQTGWNYRSRNFQLFGLQNYPPDCHNDEWTWMLDMSEPELMESTWFTVPERFDITANS